MRRLSSFVAATMVASTASVTRPFGGRGVRARKLLRVVQQHNSAAAAAADARMFVVDGEPVGRVLDNSARLLRRFGDVFEVSEAAVTLSERAGATVEERSASVAACLATLRSEGVCPLLEGWRDESFAIRSSFHSKPSLVVERAAAGLFGCPAYGVFVNGCGASTASPLWLCVLRHTHSQPPCSLGRYITSPTGPNEDGEPTALWLGRRSEQKPTWPGLLDCVSGACLFI